MKSRVKSTLILAGVLVVLIVIATVSEQARKKRRHPGAPLYPNFTAEEVARISMQKDDKRVELRKDADGMWRVVTEGDYKADENLVDKILEEIPKFHTRDLVSRNPEKQETFQVTDSLATRVTLENARGDTIVDVYIGKQGPDFMSTYVRPVGDDRVLLVPRYLRTTFNLDRDTWRDKQIFDFAQDDVTRVEILPAEGDTIALAKNEEGKWQIVEPDTMAVKESVWTSTLRIASRLRCDAFPDSVPPLSEIGLDPPEQIFRLEMADGATRVLKIGKLDERKRHYVMKEGDDTVFLLSKGRVTSLMRKLDVLKEEPPKPKAEAQPSGDSEKKAGEQASGKEKKEK
jgi:hypothetical protein